MTGPEISMVIGDAVAIAAFTATAISARNTRKRLAAARRCPGCGGNWAGYLHYEGCSGPKEDRKK